MVCVDLILCAIFPLVSMHGEITYNFMSNSCFIFFPQDQKAQLDATFDRLTQVQRVILGEFTWFNSFLFYAVAILIAYLLTSTPRTSGARLLMFAVLALDWCAERTIFSVTDSSEQV